MSRQKGIIKFRGKMGGISFYTSDGSFFARESNGPTRERIENDPNFARTRENNKEFGGAAKGGRSMRVALATALSGVSTRTLAARLTKLMRSIVAADTAGVRGERTLAISTNRVLLNNLDFSDRAGFDATFNAPVVATHTPARNDATLTVDLDPLVNLQAPTGATHFKLLHALGVVSDYVLDTSTHQYQPTDAALDSMGTVATSVLTPITGGMVHLSISALLPGTPVMTSTVSVVQCVGVEFYQQVGAQNYLLAQGNCLKVTAVF